MKKNLLSVVAISLGMLVGLVGCNNNTESTDSGKPGSSIPSTSEPATSKPDTSKPGSSDSSTSKPGSSDSSTSGQQEVVKTLKEVTDIAASLADKTPSTEEYTYTGTVSGLVGNNFYIQDSTGAFYVYMGSTNPNVAKGNKVKVKSKIQNYSGVYESSGTPVVTKLAETGDTITAKKITAISDLKKEEQSFAVAFDSVEYTSYAEGSKKNNNKGDLTLTAKLGADNLTLFVSRFVADYEGIKAKLDAAPLGGAMKIEYSLFGWNSGAPSINLISANDFEITPDAAKALAKAKTDAKNELDSYKLTDTDYTALSEADKNAVIDVKTTEKGKIDAAVDESGVQAALEAAKTEVDNKIAELKAAKELKDAKDNACTQLDAIKTSNTDYTNLSEADKATVDSLIDDKKGEINDESVTTTDDVTTKLNAAKTEVEVKIAKLKACAELDAYKNNEDYAGLSSDEDRGQVDTVITAEKAKINADSVATKEDVATALETGKKAVEDKIKELKEKTGGDDDTEPGSSDSSDSSSSDSSSSTSSPDPSGSTGSTDTTPSNPEPSTDGADDSNGD